ncbi:MAG: DegV family protein [Firmicutes bacterium]|jgi:DegV family protein with EDD domain|nr:DegV family protein [Bacillota bacterium]
MSRIAIVTDSTCDLPAELAQAHGITVIPDYVRFGEEVFRDQVDLSTAEFFKRLRDSRECPKTSQPTPAEFAQVYQGLLQHNDYVFSIHLASKLSGVCASAALGAQLVGTNVVEVVDSGWVSMGLGFAVLEAAEAANARRSVDEVRDAIRHAVASMRLLFTIDNLAYLEKSGRIGRASVFLGTLLGIKPVITIENAEVLPVERVRGASRLLPRVLDLMSQTTPPNVPIRAAVIHADALKQAAEWEAAVRSRFSCEELITCECNTIIGSYAGPGSIGVAWYPTRRF